MLDGEITTADLEVFRNLKHGIVLELNSLGGDLRSAIEIGRLLRASRSAAFVSDGNVCISACVMILAGAVDRIVDPNGAIGIHRPYSLLNTEIDQARANKDYRELERLTRDYLHDMNIPGGLFDAMVRIPADDVHLLTKEEIREYSLDSTDPVEAEMVDAAEASKYGLTRPELLNRRRESRRLCPTPTDTKFRSLSFEDKLAVVLAHSHCVDRVMRSGK